PAKRTMIEWLEANGHGEGTVTYKLRDWLFSRQRYWGEPFPIVFDDDGNPHAVPADQLPVALPEIDDYAPEIRADDDSTVPEPPLGRVAEWREVTLDLGDGPQRYRRASGAKSDVERQVDSRDKTGVFAGVYAINPVDGRELPVFVADYVLMGYGTGAIMAVPAEDERDWAFAEAFALPVIRTVAPPEGFAGGAYTGSGPAINSGFLDGLQMPETKRLMTEWLAERRLGEGTVTYKLRDWLFSRQRYWGEPFPIVYDEAGRALALPDSMLPVELPDVDDYSPRTFAPDDYTSEPEPPLGRAQDWVNVTLDLGDGPKRYRRETNTMPQWAGSCWYELRYLDPTNTERFVDPEVERYWMGPRSETHIGGVDLYVGGAEHAVLHLLYSRFWHKVLFDLGYVSSGEPFHGLFNQGYIQAYAYVDARGVYVPAEEVEERNGAYFYEGEPVRREYGKMGKSLRNAVTPDDMFAEYGADTLRLYEMSMGPLESSRPWDTRAVVGSYRFLQRVWRMVVDEETGAVRVTDEAPSDELNRLLHKTIDGVRSDFNDLKFNTSVAKLIELTNAVTKAGGLTPRAVAEAVVLMLAPLAPHTAEELWSLLGHAETLAYEGFPVADPALLIEETVTCVVQVGGKVRDRLEVRVDVGEDELRALALATPGAQRALEGREIRTVVVRPPRLVNIVLV
ncbi:MAG: leucyl-tRNA synthetase, partial [Frankiales bacterium]|nr:leucyl-tRNA synthetase [Frankiales bacterium]